MQTGHFLLYYDNTEAILLPGIADRLTGPRHTAIASEIGYYPLLTWQIGLRALAAVDAKHKLVMIVVNDWQYLPDGVDRSEFYDHFPNIPASYQNVLAEIPSVEMLVPPRKPNYFTGMYFSEQTLRNAYEKHIKKLIERSDLPHNAITESAREVTCSLQDSLGHKKEIYCSSKRQNCTHEVAELIWTVHELADADVFINFFPLVCKEYMLEGTELSHELFRHGVRKVINVGMQSSHVHNENDIFRHAEVIIHEF
jgi:hypothetical protein